MSLEAIGPIAHLSFSGDFGGREKVALLLAQGMQKENIKGFLYIFIEKRAGEGRNAHLMLALKKIEKNKRIFEEHNRFSFHLLRKMTKQLTADGVGIVHCHCYKSLAYILLARLLGFWKGVVFFTLHGLILGSDIRSKMIKLVQYTGMRMADGIIGCSHEVLKNTVPEGWSKNQHVIVNGIETVATSYDEIQNKKADARTKIIARLGLRDDALIAINVGRLTPQKNFSLYLQLIEKRKNDAVCDNVQYLIVGNGEMSESLYNEALARSISGDVVFTGFVAEIEEIYLAADLLIQTSVWEGTPMCLLEARSYGLPSIVPDVGGNIEVLTTGQDGFLFPKNDLGELDVFLEMYIKSSELREIHGRRAFDDILARYSVDTWVERHLQFYCSLQKKQLGA